MHLLGDRPLDRAQLPEIHFFYSTISTGLAIITEARSCDTDDTKNGSDARRRPAISSLIQFLTVISVISVIFFIVSLLPVSGYSLRSREGP